MTDSEIAKSVKMRPISEIAGEMGISPENLELYGRYKAKINGLLPEKQGRLVLVTATNPTPAGEGKTTTSVGLSMALNKLGYKSALALREPSLGPVFGIKGGAAGGGWSQVLPMDDINLHFTGDFHAITSANNLIAAMTDNHITHGNSLDIDPSRIVFKRCLDMNDRALRSAVIGLGGKANGYPREDKFQISVASEIMAVLCLSRDIFDLKERIGNILIAYSREGVPVFAKDIKAEGAAAALLKDAVYPNLVQTTENTPAFIHGGPFANIAHGCNSVAATKTALAYSDYCITEAGFGSDLGAEKFINIKCRLSGLKPSCAVVVTTVRTLKYNGGVNLKELTEKNVKSLSQGICNLSVHVENLQNFGLPVIVALNRFASDTQEEIDFISDFCKRKGAELALSDVFSKGGAGGLELAEKVVKACSTPELNFTYNSSAPIKEKILSVAKNIYRAGSVKYTPAAEKAISETEKIFGSDFPVCIAKTQYSLSDNPKLLGAPEGFELTITDGYLNNGAGFFTALAGSIMTMPGLPRIPSAENIGIDKNGEIYGLF